MSEEMDRLDRLLEEKDLLIAELQTEIDRLHDLPGMLKSIARATNNARRIELLHKEIDVLRIRNAILQTRINQLKPPPADWDLTHD